MGDLQRVMWKQKRGKCFNSFTPYGGGPGEIRTLVQTWDQMRFLHAYPVFGFRD